MLFLYIYLLFFVKLLSTYKIYIASTSVASTSGLTSNILPTNSESEETDSDLTDSTESSHSTSLSDREGISLFSLKVIIIFFLNFLFPNTARFF